MTSALQEISPNAEIVSAQQALKVNAAAAVGLMNVLKSNLGPTGTLKLLVGGAGQLKLTKDGLTLLKEMQIQHPTAALIARTATAQDDVTGDGTTSTVLLTGELLRQGEQYASSEGLLHPRVLTDGFDVARDACLEFLKSFAQNYPNVIENRDILHDMARTSLQTKLDGPLVDQVRNFARCTSICMSYFRVSLTFLISLFYISLSTYRWLGQWWMPFKRFTKRTCRLISIASKSWHCSARWPWIRGSSRASSWTTEAGIPTCPTRFKRST